MNRLDQKLQAAFYFAIDAHRALAVRYLAEDQGLYRTGEEPDDTAFLEGAARQAEVGFLQLLGAPADVKPRLLCHYDI